MVEVGLRVFSLAPSVGISTVSESEFRRVPGLFGPGQSVRDEQIPALPYSVHIDSLGFRGHEIPRKKSPGEVRIFAIGDSFTYGDYVDDGQTVPAVVEGQLSRACHRPVTVINAGVGGSTITTQIEMLRRGWAMSPDVVVLTFFENDVTDLRENMWRDLAENRRAKSQLPLSILYPVMRHSALWHFALAARARMHARAIEASVASLPAARAADVAALRAEYERDFRELVKEVGAKGVPLVLVAFPSHWTVRGAQSDEQLRWVEQMARAAGVPTVDLLGLFRSVGLPTDSLYLLPHDGHASVRGNALAGEAVAMQLVRLGLCGRSVSID